MKIELFWAGNSKKNMNININQFANPVNGLVDRT